ncbi:hypothetical protein BDQ17DRAFT_1229861 [Cyathus striatus]|nr:hypothetical protein BDQ17DRAFT_1229861 [Cyathus striatus]
MKGTGVETRRVLQMSGQLCPKELFACPIAEAGTLLALPSSLAVWAAEGYACTDVTADLHDCGGCSALDARHDCFAIPGAQDIACVNSNCEVYSCITDYTLSRKGNHCVKV